MEIRKTNSRFIPLVAVAASALVLGTSAKASSENVSFSLSLDYNSHFISYGANVWDGEDENRKTFDGLLFQPSAELSFALTEGSGIYTGVWFDINDNLPSGVGGRIQEVDIWLGYYFTVEDFVFDFTFNQWYYGGETEGTFDISVGYEGVFFAPYILAHHRFDPNGPQETGTIFEVGATAYEMDAGPVSLSFPVGVGFTFDDYYVEDESGYVYSFVGAGFGMPLDFFPEGYGDWGLHGGLTVFHTDEDVTGNEESVYVALNLGVGLSF